MSKNSAAVFASRIAYPGCYQCCLQVPAWTRPGVGTTCLPKSLNIFLRRYRLAPLANIDGFLERQIADLEQLVTRRIIANHVILDERVFHRLKLAGLCKRRRSLIKVSNRSLDS